MSVDFICIRRIIKYSKLQGTHKDHRVECWTPHRTTQKSHHVYESAVQMLLELQQSQCCDHCLGEPVQCLNAPTVTILFLTPNLKLPLPNSVLLIDSLHINCLVAITRLFVTSRPHILRIVEIYTS